ncbi:hypothetical protein D9613_009187 [Agrocybe pediades]|uniref:VOC domain-containing protein n=1 Tax=Agrocybe pediades TaxID=84607 RepID=A0A8H4R3E6_9AGAR|nr:hypothetical protein D9613_009187 [Agrocybe pediades]KAF9555714.1 Glyoxalase/Bleomycin resistance protein/Dihydroxybiphenyl dioxygenase [Agrocybe pediades]
MLFHHLGIQVQDLEKSKAFYTAALKPLGYTLNMSFADGQVIGYGVGHTASFCISGPESPASKALAEKNEQFATGPLHLAFNATSRQQVNEFYEAAIAAGGKDNGAPGIRRHYSWYSGNYYAAFVLDTEGRNIEVVCIGTEPTD